jgi:malate dehydrogenase (oxaloacetate-decarboxylating)
VAVKLQPSAGYSLIVRTETSNQPGTLGQVFTAIGEEGGDIGAIDIVRAGGGKMVRDITVAARDEAHAEAIVSHVRELNGVNVLHVTDRTFLVHLGGKLSVEGKTPVKGREDLSMIYAPGVARVSLAIHADPLKQWTLTVKRHTIAVVTDGSAVLRLGNLGPAPAQPVMEGKCMIFKAFADLDAFPICLATQEPDAIVTAVAHIAPVFGGIALADIAAPRCFEVEDRLRSGVTIPVMHDDQHGAAVVVLAALSNALRVVGKSIDSARIVVCGAGVAGMGTGHLLVAAGAPQVIVCDRAGALYSGRSERMNSYKERLAQETNPDRQRGSLREMLRGADVFIGLSGPGVLSAADVSTMAADPIVFAMANPIPEVTPEDLAGVARVVATGRSDLPNQLNNSLASPGIFRGALEAQATDIDDSMKLAAARALADLVGPDELHEEYIIPSLFDRRVAEAVTRATREAARASGLARRP